MLLENRSPREATFEVSCIDAVEWLRGLPSECLDLVVTDPPYESLEKHRALGTTTRLKHSKSSSNDWFKIFPNSRFPELLKEVFRVLKNGSHFYLFCDAETMFVVKPIAEAEGFKFWKPIIWDKVNIGMGYHYRARYETILFFEKGKRKLNDLSVPDVLQFPRVMRGYPTEKPVSVSEVLIKQSSNPGEVVADPFMGSGSVGIAALRLGRSFIGNDISKDAWHFAESRLLEADRQRDHSPQRRGVDDVLEKFRQPESVSEPVSDSPRVNAAETTLSEKRCPMCSRREGRDIVKPIAEFGTRIMRNGAVKFQSYCKSCR